MMAAVNSPSTSGSSRTFLFNKRSLILAGGSALALTVFGYLAYRRFIRTGHRGDALYEAERKKAEGIEAFRKKDYDAALKIFTESIEMLFVSQEDESNKAKKDELLASCENNIAACYDALGDTVHCLEHCNTAIGIKQDYAKALARRAKCHFKLGQGEKAIDDYLDLICLENIDKKQANSYQTELDRVADSILIPELNSLIQKRLNTPLKISQITVNVWVNSTVTNDPLLARMEKLDAHNDSYEGIDSALAALQRRKYDEIVSLTSPIIEDESFDSLERAEAVLLATRFIYYQGQKEAAREAITKFGHFWDKLDDAHKLAHKDLNIAHISLQVTIIELVDGISDNEFSINEVNKQKCYQLVEDGLRINPKNVDPLITLGVRLMELEQLEDALAIFQRIKKLDNKHPYNRFYEMYANFMIGLRQQSIAIVHNQIMLMQKELDESEKPPIFALIMLAKLAMVLQNNQLAIEAAKRVLKLMPYNTYAIYFCSLLDGNPEEVLTNQEKFSNYVQKIERAMRKAIEADANFWEPYRMLGKISVDRQDFEGAYNFYTQALELARSRDELMTLLKERLMLNIIGSRVRKGKPIPKNPMMSIPH